METDGPVTLRVRSPARFRSPFTLDTAQWVVGGQKQRGVATAPATAERAADAALAAVKRGLRREQDVWLVGWEVFAVARCPARRGLNPNTNLGDDPGNEDRALQGGFRPAGSERSVRVMRWFLVRRGVRSGLG